AGLGSSAAPAGIAAGRARRAGERGRWGRAAQIYVGLMGQTAHFPAARRGVEKALESLVDAAAGEVSSGMCGVEEIDEIDRGLRAAQASGVPATVRAAVTALRAHVAWLADDQEMATRLWLSTTASTEEATALA